MSKRDIKWYAQNGAPPLEPFVWASFDGSRTVTDEVCVACRMLPISCRTNHLFKAAEKLAKMTMQIMEEQGKLQMLPDGWYVKTEEAAQ